MIRTFVGGKTKIICESAENMMRDFVNEKLVQQEFDFDKPKYAPENPDDYKQDMMDIAADAYEERESEERWFPVYDAIDAAQRKAGDIKSVNGGIDALAAYRGELPVVSTWQDGDAVMVSERRVMADPLDSDLYEKHFDALGQIAANMPKGFEADFDCKPGKQSKYIGNKYIVAKEESRNSDQTGVETYIVYDAIETLRILPAQGEAKEYAEINEGELDDDITKASFENAFEKAFPDIAKDDYEVLCYDEDGRKSLNLRVYDAGKAHSREFSRSVENMMRQFGCTDIERVDVPDEPDWATWQSFCGQAGNDGGDCIEVDFPAWALDYMVNAEIGSVSRQERDQIESWKQMIGLNGYDVSLASYGDEEYFSSSPEFGLPCDCVTAKIPSRQNKLNESAGDIIRVLCVTNAEFEDDYAEQRAWASREGKASVAEETEKDRIKAENFKFPVYSNIAFPAFMTEWFYDSDLFEAHRNEIEARALPVWNSLNGFKFVKAVSLEFEDATDDMLAESDDPVSKYLDGIGLISEQEGTQSLYRISACAYTADEDPYNPAQTEYKYDCWAMSPREAAQIAARNFMGDFNDMVQLAKPMSEDWDSLVDDLSVVDEEGHDVTREFLPEFNRLCRDYARQVWG